MGKRPRDDEDDGGLDSLLDTMTNVVGILVLVLIVTQMSVADVVSRLTAENQIDEEKIVDLNERIAVKEEEKNELESVLVDPLDIDPEKQRQELERKKELLERRKRLLADKQKQQNEFSIKVERDREMAEKNRQIMADTAEKRKELQAELNASLEKRAELQAKLATTPIASAPADIQVSIPNPRPPPPGAKQLMVVCWDDRLYPVAIERFRKNAEQQAKQIIARFNLNRNPGVGIDPQAFAKYWERLKAQDDFFDVEYFVAADRYPRLRLIPREDRGATIKQLINPTSRIRSAQYFGGVDVTKTYARFFVLPDSFDAYVLARRFFSDAGMLAGWEPQSQDWQLTSHITGGIELGPPVEKKPAPPGKPRKPQNLID